MTIINGFENENAQIKELQTKLACEQAKNKKLECEQAKNKQLECLFYQIVYS